jgi:hypothetical protein
MRLSYHLLRAAVVSLTLLAIPVLNADVTLRYKLEIKPNPGLPAQMTQAMQGTNAIMPKETLMQFKNGKGYSSSGMNAITDFTSQEITILDPAAKAYAHMKFDGFGDQIAAAMPQMPDQAKAALAAMKTHVQSKTTGGGATIQGVETEEHLIEMTVDGPAADNMPQGPMMRMVIHVWIAKTSEIMRVPAIRELAGYHLFAAATMNPVASMQKMFQQMPGLGDSMTGMIKDLQSGTQVILRMRLDMFMPMFAAMMKQRPAGADPSVAALDPDAPFMHMNQEVAELSTDSIPDSVFQIPEGYKSVPVAEIMKEMIKKTQSPAKQ